MAMAMAPPLAPAGGVPAAQADVAPPGSDGGLSRGGVQRVSLNASGIVFADALVAQEDVAGLEDAEGRTQEELRVLTHSMQVMQPTSSRELPRVTNRLYPTLPRPIPPSLVLTRHSHGR